MTLTRLGVSNVNDHIYALARQNSISPITIYGSSHRDETTTDQTVTIVIVITLLLFELPHPFSALNEFIALAVYQYRMGLTLPPHLRSVDVIIKIFNAIYTHP